MTAGRPSTYTPEVAATICARLEAGESLRAICASDDMPARTTVRGWVIQDIEGFADRYASARDAGLEEMAEDLLEIADDAAQDVAMTEKGPVVDHEHIARSRLRVDTRKWLLSKRLPKAYGDKSAVEVSGPGGGPVQLTWGDGTT